MPAAFVEDPTFTFDMFGITRYISLAQGRCHKVNTRKHALRQSFLY